jgi:hypothetical protein
VTTPTLGQLQREYAICFARTIVWIYEQGWQVTIDEGFVGNTDARDGDHDGPHRRAGGHYKKLATDINLFVDGKLVSDGQHPAWRQIARFWESLHPSARSIPGDRNHLAFIHAGVI